MQTIRCAKCRQKLFKYRKIGKGKLIRCWKERIIEDYTERNGNQVLCECGNLVGIDEGNRIVMKQNAFTRTGSVTRKG